MTRAAMGDERRWAARYQFLEELWRGRDRIVCDRELEGALHGSPAGHGEGPLGELLAALIPGQGEQPSERVWVALHNDRRAASFARERSGTVFASIEEAAELASDERWQVALVHLQAASRGELANMESFLEVLGERLEDDPERSVVLSLPCTADEDASYELLAELVEELFGDGRIYGLTHPSMVAFYDFGPVLEPERDAEQASGEADIEVDNVLGSETPRFEAFIAVVGASIPGEGVTFIELPGRSSDRSESAAGRPATGGDDELAALRVQLAEAQRRGDMHAIERQSLLEKLEQAEDRIANLEDQLADASASPTASNVAAEASASASNPAGPRVDELLAREQTLRWEIERLRGEIERLEARPVEELEAEVASLRAELDRAQVELELATAQLSDAQDEGDDQDEGADIEEDEDELDEQALAELARLAESLQRDDEEPTAARVREWRRARSKLEHLLRKLERGGRLSALELHRELVALKNLL